MTAQMRTMNAQNETKLDPFVSAHNHNFLETVQYTLYDNKPHFYLSHHEPLRA